MAKIVIVDDDEILTDLVTEHLEVNGHQVIAVHHGSDAVTTVLDQQVQLVILDQSLPGRSGMEILAELRALPDALDLPIMMLTNSGSRLHIEFADKSGADDYVTKPVNLYDLTSRVRALLLGSEISRVAREGGAVTGQDRGSDRPDKE